MENLNQVQQLGFDTYLQNQFSSTVTPYPNPFPNDSIGDVQRSFFLNSIAGGDQLRERVAMALNELWVVGADTENDPRVTPITCERWTKMRWEIIWT